MASAENVFAVIGKGDYNLDKTVSNTNKRPASEHQTSQDSPSKKVRSHNENIIQFTTEHATQFQANSTHGNTVSNQQLLEYLGID